ncbi:MAG: succinylglutamate desuccinylase/aspartoacylase family protein [Simkaniaceae bacterium]
MKNEPLNIGNITIQGGERITLALPTPELYTCAPLYIPAHIIHGKKAGPTLLICGAIHGDEINGVAMIQKLLKLRMLDNLKGTLIVIPTLNIYGMMTLSRNLPDRRDLEGSFPGSETGSFASRLAYFLTETIFSKITHCIDLHTGEPHISKFPHTKTFFENEDAKNLAHAFGAPVVMDTQSHQGLLWLLHRAEKSIPTIIYEVGEALRLDASGIKMGVQGISRVMKYLGMLTSPIKGKATKSAVAQSDYWVRVPSSGLCETFVRIGAFVKKGTKIARIFDPFGTEQKEEIFAPIDGIITAKNNLPILNEGEPIFQIMEIAFSQVEQVQNWKTEEKEDSLLE